MRIKELRAKAREDAQGNYWNLALPFFLLTSIIYLLGIIPNNLSNPISKGIAGVLVFCVILFVSIAGSYAIMIRSIKIARKEELNGFFSDMFGEGMKNGFSCAWGIFKKIWHWIVLMIISNFSLIACSILFLPFDRQTIIAKASNSPIYIIIGIIGIILFLLSLIMIIIKSYQYYLITFLKHDYPEKSTNELLEKSKEMMDGNKAKAIVIPLTFIGWLLLSALVGAVISVGFNLIWPPIVTLGVSAPTMPIWAEILQQIMIYFISSFVSAYLFMTYIEFYFERHPLEIYNEDYIKPETNPSKYKKIIALTIVLFILFYIIIGVIAGIIFYQANNLTNDAIDSLDSLMKNISVPE